MQLSKGIKILLALFVSWTLLVQGAPVITTTSSDKSGNLGHIPEKALVVLHMKSFPETIAQFKNSFLYRTFLDYQETDVFKNICSGNPELAVTINMVKSMFEELPKAFTGEFTFGLTPDDMSALFIIEGDEKEFRRVVENVFAPVVKEFGESDLIFAKIGDTNKISFDNSDEGLFYRIEGSRMVFALKDDSFGVLKDGKPLPQNQLFKDTMNKQNVSPDSLLFINLREIYKMTGVNEEQKGFLKATGISEIEGIALSSTYREKGVNEKATIYATKGLSGALGLLNRSGSEPTIEKYIPEGFAVAARLSVGNLNELYKDFIKIMSKDEENAGDLVREINSVLQDIQEEYGISVEKDLLPALGGEFGVGMESPDNPLSFAAFAEVKDKKKIEELIKTLEKSGITFTAKEYKGVNIYSMDGGIIRPAYAFLDNYVVLSAASSILEEIVDVKAGAKSILEKKDYKNAFADMPKKSTISVYADMEKILPYLAQRLFYIPLRNNEDADSRDTIRVLLSTLQKNTKGIQGEALTVTADKNSIYIERSSSMAAFDLILPVFMSFHIVMRAVIMMPAGAMPIDHVDMIPVDE